MLASAQAATALRATAVAPAAATAAKPLRRPQSARALASRSSGFVASAPSLKLAAPKAAARPAAAAQAIVAPAIKTYTQKDVDDALSFIERMNTFPVNYYSQIKLKVSDCFANTGIQIPANLAAKEFVVDFSTLSREKAPPEIIEDALRIEGIRIYRKTQRNTSLNEIRASYGNPQSVEAENKKWWATHCQALRDGDKKNRTFTIDGVTEEYSGLTVLFNEYRDELMYFTKDSLYDSAAGISATPTQEGLAGYWYGRGKGNTYESSWWAMLANPRVRMTWPRVTFSGEDVSFDWVCFDINTNEMTAYGDVVWIRTGDKGGCYKKYEHLYFLRDVYKSFFDNYFAKKN
eukprot:jgi/Chlat1/2840/Chrsp194S02997